MKTLLQILFFFLLTTTLSIISKAQSSLTHNTGTNRNIPVAVSTSGVLSGKIITKVTAGAFHCLALDSDGIIYIWEFNDKGKLGNGITGTSSNIPVAVSTSGLLNGKIISQISAGFDHSLVLDSEGNLYSWGNNTYGELGNGNNSDSNVPVLVEQSLLGLLPVDDNLIDEFNFELNQNYPNPFNPTAKIKFSIPNVGTGLALSVLKVYDILGNEVATLVNEEKPSGSYGVEFDTSGLSSGIYFYKLQVGSFSQTKKMILLR
jgi:hypothetical protein